MEIKLTGSKQTCLVGNWSLNENIFMSNICTRCQNDLFSYRAEGGKTGRMAAVIMLVMVKTGSTGRRKVVGEIWNT